jgi:hypothetical protein
MKGVREAVEWALWDSKLSDLGPIFEEQTSRETTAKSKSV